MKISRLLIQLHSPFFPFEHCLLPSVYWGNEQSLAKIIYIKMIIHCQYCISNWSHSLPQISVNVMKNLSENLGETIHSVKALHLPREPSTVPCLLLFTWGMAIVLPVPDFPPSARLDRAVYHNDKQPPG